MQIKKAKKGAIEMNETILVLFIISIILVLIIFVYYKYTISSIESSSSSLSEQEALVQLSFLTKYPELSCENDNCIDMLKAISFKQVYNQNKDYYLRTFGKKKITIEQVYPKPTSEDECTSQKFNQIDYPNNCKFLIIYEEVPPTYTSKQITSIPISIFYPELEEFINKNNTWPVVNFK